MIKANRTTSLLLPFYSGFGNEFMSVFEQVLGKGAKNVRLYMGDANYSSSFLNFTSFLLEDLIFVQILEEPFNFEKCLLYLQSHPNYVADYSEENYKVVVFKVDEPFVSALKNLKQSNYSKMYDKVLIDKFFGMTKDWYMMYADDHQIIRFPMFANNQMASLDYLRDKWDAINAKNFFQNLIMSPFHVFNKSENLRLLLEHIYEAEIPKENELIEKIKLKDEILNYEC